MSMMRRRLLDNTVLKTAEGESMVVRSVARTEPGLSLYGKSHQKTVAGNQLLNPELFQENKYQNFNIGDGNFSIANNTLYWITGKIPVEPSTQYSISKANFGGAFYADEYTPITTSVISFYSATFVTPENCHYICVNFDKKDVPFRSNVMMNKGSTLLPYEPYTGGKPSPNPDYKQEVEITGKDGNIGVDVYGGNLADISQLVNIGGSSYVQISDTGFSFTYSEQEVNARLNQIPCKLKKGKQYICTAERSSNYITIYLPEISQYLGFGTAFTPNEDVNYITVYVNIGGPYDTYIVEHFMINVGDTALPWEPYKTPQSMTLSTPGGLPGIPVSSGGNYTDENGQQWTSDEIDFKRGKYVKRVAWATFDGKENWKQDGDASDEGLSYYYYKIPGTMISGIKDGMCSHASWLLKERRMTWREGYYTNSGDGSFEVQTDMTLDEWKSYLSGMSESGNPVKVVLALDLPTETDLTPEQIAAYQSLHTNYPATTAMNDSDAGMKLTYKTRKSLEVT